MGGDAMEDRYPFPVYPTLCPRLALLASQQAQPHGERPSLPAAVSQILRSAQDVVHYVRVQVARQVVESEPPRPQIVQGAELPFQLQVHVEVIRVALRVRPAHHETLLVHHTEREARSEEHTSELQSLRHLVCR